MEVLHAVFDAITGHHQQKKIEGKVVLMKKNVLDFNDFNASVLDRVHELVGKKVSLQLISASHGDPKGNELKGKLGKKAYLEDWVTKLTSLTAGDSVFDVTFDWEEDVGVPGAFLIRNSHHSEFFLKSLTLEDVPGQGRVHFVCNSWVYPADKYKSDRVFFVNQTYLPGETPAPLLPYRRQELVNLRGNGTGKLEDWDRVYDYAYYNDLGDAANPRPVLGGSAEYPYPRRGRTGRPPIKEDPKTESRIPLLMSLNIYVPRDERFGHLKLSDFLAYALKSIVQFLLPEFKALCDSTPNEFDSFEDTLELYKLEENIPLELLKQLVRTDGEGVFKFPMPQIIQADETAWRTDEEFGREMLSGVNPVSIRRLEEFPPISKLDADVYGNQNSSMNEDYIKNNLDGLTIDEALETNRLFILDHHDALMPYLKRINTTSSKIYATRTVLFLQKDGTLKPLAIELSLPHPDGDKFGAISEVYTPAEDGVEGWIWQLAKAYAAVNDSGVHQLISHWLNTHAVIEPFVIATNRQLSVLHPIHKLLHPHFRDTMNINGFARQTLINGGGILEKTVFPGKYAMELSSAVYKNWVFTEQGLPADLIKRGMAVKDANAPHGLRLLIEDYPYAVDGLKIWSAIETWVREYCNVHYKNDETVQKDTELQSWWKELKEEGHGDKKDEPWWPKMQTLEDLVESCTITIWVASALHAAVNFGQYPYAGYLPNRPTVSRRFMPKPGTPEYDELKENPEKAFLKTITAQLQTLLGISLIEILSRHSSDEVYLGQRDTREWTTNEDALAAFGAFGKKLGKIEDEIVEMNNDRRLKNRVGPAKLEWRLSDESLSDDCSEEEKNPVYRESVRCKVFLGFTSNLISSGIRETLKYLAQHRMVDVLVTTAGGIEEDLIKCLGATYKGDFSLPGAQLRSKGLNRIGNLLVPNDNYCKFEDWIIPIFDQMLEEQTLKNVLWTPSRVIARLGKEINDDSSYLYWAYKNNIPVYCPASTDGSLGDMLYFHSFRNPGLVVDLVQDVRAMNGEAVHASPRKTGIIILGGGLPKHHICNANMMRNGADYAVFINTAQEFDGSDSGARPDEAVSWGKIRASAESVKV